MMMDLDKISSAACEEVLFLTRITCTRSLYMHQSIKQTIMNQPEQQLLSCSFEESLGMIAPKLIVSELSMDNGTVKEHLKQQPRKSFR
jgi:hypothetical protein